MSQERLIAVPQIVYFIAEKQIETPSKGPEFIKIGWARTGNAVRRRGECQTGNPRRLELFRVLKGTALVENRFHRLLAEYRVEGEWFRLPPAILDEIGNFEGEDAQKLVEHLRDKFSPAEVL